MESMPDLKKQDNPFCNPSAREPVLIEVPEFRFLAIEASGGSLSGHHHEIYLNDYRRVDPVRMRTVLRQPFVR